MGPLLSLVEVLGGNYTSSSAFHHAHRFEAETRTLKAKRGRMSGRCFSSPPGEARQRLWRCHEVRCWFVTSSVNVRRTRRKDEKGAKEIERSFVLVIVVKGSAND